MALQVARTMTDGSPPSHCPISTAGQWLEVEGGGWGAAGLGFIVSIELEPELELNSNHAHYLSNNIFCKQTFFLYEEKKKKKEKKHHHHTLTCSVFVQMFHGLTSPFCWRGLPPCSPLQPARE